MEAARRRILRFLEKGPAEQKASGANKAHVLLEADEKGTVSVSRGALIELISEGVVVSEGGRLRLGGEGSDPLGARARVVQSTVIGSAGETIMAELNLAESPLGALMRRKNKNGARFLTEAEFAAGERLRADYTRGQMMPRLGANWEASVSSGRRGGGGAGGVPDLTDTALAARMRAEKAIAAVGPELAGVLVDVCCFLKGLEQVESERGWPVRSAKIVLKTALGALSRHYKPAAAGKSRKVLHWGSDDYRPELTERSGE